MTIISQNDTFNYFYKQLSNMDIKKNVNTACQINKYT